uniref:Uncharacterized protein n=1 Tax=Timema cristinae TaxID=61476 RepID=A0A7R9GPR4_TIMCR|nr:unnamed protein product [Timema cristinae]
MVRWSRGKKKPRHSRWRSEREEWKIKRPRHSKCRSEAGRGRKRPQHSRWYGEVGERPRHSRWHGEVGERPRHSRWHDEVWKGETSALKMARDVDTHLIWLQGYDGAEGKDEGVHIFHVKVVPIYQRQSMCIEGLQAYTPSLLRENPISVFMSRSWTAARASTKGQSKKSPLLLVPTHLSINHVGNHHNLIRVSIGKLERQLCGLYIERQHNGVRSLDEVVSLSDDWDIIALAFDVVPQATKYLHINGDSHMANTCKCGVVSNVGCGITHPPLSSNCLTPTTSVVYIFLRVHADDWNRCARRHSHRMHATPTPHTTYTLHHSLTNSVCSLHYSTRTNNGEFLKSCDFAQDLYP